MAKRILDIALGLTLLIFFAPVFIVIAVLIKLDSKGPVLFTQDRIGKDGVIFKMLKFRSMIEHADRSPIPHNATDVLRSGSIESPAELFSFSDDPRITKVGRVLRVASLDELPQIINVLNGTMSFVGPRPPVFNELGDYKDFNETLKKRFMVKPGITGLAQISGRNDLNWDEKIILDNMYVDKYLEKGIWLDLVILFKTPYVVLFMKNTIEKRVEN
ncbi:sugar transferase [Geomonas sp. Red69]|uniref:sugar transferase n=1 Tax=Geomonas diazotrophica TaxID=2843197 RepID=UPI001C115DB6|nr:MULTISPECIES: sugar transferase [Geomonas]MBU5636059.1 sugar transferase [Geomonas diazotrophica]QXE85028.1 sugar transferase [Geomonas nitrogeniifigens]